MTGIRPDDAAPRTLLIVWHSKTGACRQLSEAAAAGAVRSQAVSGSSAARSRAEAGGGADVSVVRVHARRAGVAQMLAASAYLFVAPENLGSTAGVMKDFFDRTYYPLLDRINGRAFAVVVAAGSDGEGAVRQIGRICNGWRLRQVASPAIVRTHAQSAEAILAPKRVSSTDLARAAELGEALAEGLALGVF